MKAVLIDITGDDPQLLAQGAPSELKKLARQHANNGVTSEIWVRASGIFTRIKGKKAPSKAPAPAKKRGRPPKAKN